MGDEDRPFAEIRRTIHDVLRLLSLHRWAFFVPFSVVTCAVFILSLYYPRTYRASSSFERRNDPVMMNLPISTGAASYKYFRNTMVRDLTSIECLSEVVENLDLTKNWERNEDGTLTEASIRRRNGLAGSLARTLSVSTVSPSEHIDIIRVTYTGPDPDIGRRLVDEVKRTYIRRTMTWIHEFLTSQQDYFRQEAGDALVEAKRARREETKLRLENPHVDPTNPGAIALKLAQLEMERRELLMRQREYEAEQAAVQQMLAAVEPQANSQASRSNQGNEFGDDAVLSPRALQLSARIHTIDREIEKLQMTRGMTNLHPKIQELLTQRRLVVEEFEQQRIQDRHAAVSNETLPASRFTGAAGLDATISMTAVMAGLDQSGRAGKPAWRQLLVQISAQKTKLKDIGISLDANALAIRQLRQAKRGVFQKQEEFAEITGQVAKARQKLAGLEGTLASIDPAIKAIEQGRLLQFSEGLPARGSSIPISPKATTVVLLATLAGILAGTLFVILAEVFDNVYRSSGQVARGLGLPMLESIDEIVTSEDRRHIFLRKALFTPLVIICFAGLAGLTGSMAYLSIERPRTYEKIRRIPEAALQLFAGEPDG
jgi:uncharacterized protein involved in exopolysaccharide biosynthesis